MPTKSEIMDFEIIIDRIVTDKKINYIDAILNYCETNRIEVEVAAALTGRSLKNKLAVDAGSLNYLPKKSKLPL